MACIFCGSSGPIDKEHLLNRWLRTYLHDEQAGRPGAQITGGQNKPLTRKIHTYPLKGWRRVVCKDCNSGWMGRLEGTETGVRPFLEPLVQGKPVVLSVQDQELFMRWIVKLAIVWEYLDTDTITTTPALRRRFMETQLPPLATQIRVGSFDIYSASTPMLYWHEAHVMQGEHIGSSDALQAQWTSITIAHIAIHIFMGTWEEQVTVGLPDHIAPKYRQIWPVLGAQSFPAAPLITQLDIARMMHPVD